MVALVEPDIEECYLLAILDSPDGIDLGEFAVHDPRNDDGCYRLYDFQWRWWSCRDTYQIDQGARSCGKTEGIKLRALAFPFYRPGAGMLISAPELNHLRPLTDEIEKMLLNTRIVREMLPAVKSAGIARQPHWQVRFKNGSSIISRLPNKDGRGVKGCLSGDVRVLTRRGHVPIAEVVAGDEVLTHMNRWRSVTATYAFPGGEGLLVKGSGHRGLVVSDSHAFYGRRNSNPQRTRNLSAPMWVDAVNPELQRWYWATPLRVPSEPLPLPKDFGGSVAELLGLAGAYVADGYTATDGSRICIVDAWADAPRLEHLAKDAGYATNAFPHREHPKTTARVEIYSRALVTWLIENFGRLANGKRLPVWLLGAPELLRRAFWDDYCAGDGHWVAARRRWEVSTASRTLACDLKLLATGLGYDAGFSWVDPKVTHIAGRELLTAPQRSFRVHAVESGHKIVEFGHAWGKIGAVTPVEVASFHDLSVEEDHSYVAEGIVQHNQHVDELHIDEAQDFNAYGWREIVETLNTGAPDAMWRCHGVSRGVRDAFFEKSQPGSGWKVHRPMAMNRPSWSKEERDAKIVEYGGSRQSVDYRRNIYGEHGDASNSVFVLAKLMACVDLDEGSVYNQDVYSCTKIQFERFPRGSSDSERMAMLHGWIEIPGEHFHGYSQRVDKNREVGAPRGYSAYWGGMDVGVTNHPSEILIFGQRSGTEELELLTRVQMHRVNTDDQMVVVERLFEIYGGKLRLGIDKTGVGFPLWDQLTRRPSFGERIFGFGFSEKRLAAIEDRPLQTGETIKDLAIMRNVVETATDLLRNDYVDTKRLRLPYDREVLIEFQGQSYNVVRDNGDPYGVRRQYTGGSFHCVDESTEIMTSGGWRRYDQVEVGDDVLTMDVATGCSRWSPIEALNIQSGPPIMIRSKSNAHDSLTTGSHRWPVRLYDGRTGTFGPLKWKTTATLSGGDGVPVAVPYGGAPAEAVYSDAFVELMAWYWTEGNCTKSNTVISQSSISEDNVERIRKALTEEFGPAGYMPEGFWHEYWSGTTCYFMLSMRVGCLLRSLAPDCNVRPEFLLALTACQLDLFIRTSERGDGNHHPNSTRRAFQHQRDRQKTDALEMACALAGIATSTRVYERPTSRSGVSITVALLDKRFVRPANFRVEEPYSGDVWCPTTRDGTWLARRSGTVYWTGNSLDAAKVAVATKHIPPLEALLETRPVRGAVFDVFMGA